MGRKSGRTKIGRSINPADVILNSIECYNYYTYRNFINVL